MSNILAIVAASAATLVTLSCNEMESAAHVEESENPPQNVTTRAPGDKTPATICYIGTDTFFDYVVLFVSNIHNLNS